MNADISHLWRHKYVLTYTSNPSVNVVITHTHTRVHDDVLRLNTKILLAS